MKLEQVIPMMRDEGKIITRTKPFGENNTVVFVKMEDNQMKFKVIWTTQEMTKWANYRLRTEDINADNWEIAG